MAPYARVASGPMRFSQIRSPVRPSSACTVLLVLARYMMPLWTMGVGSLAPPSFIAQTHSSCRSFTFAVVIW